MNGDFPITPTSILTLQLMASQGLMASDSSLSLDTFQISMILGVNHEVLGVGGSEDSLPIVLRRCGNKFCICENLGTWVLFCSMER